MKTEARNGGNSCEKTKESQSCYSQSCVVSQWSDWGLCSGSGIRERSREVQKAPSKGGNACGKLFDYDVCQPPVESKNLESMDCEMYCAGSDTLDKCKICKSGYKSLAEFCSMQSYDFESRVICNTDKSPLTIKSSGKGKAEGEDIDEGEDDAESTSSETFLNFSSPIIIVGLCIIGGLILATLFYVYSRSGGDRSSKIPV